jgi:hypothetical protein
MKNKARILFIFCIYIIFFTNINVFACNYSSVDKSIKISLSVNGSAVLKHTMVSITRNGVSIDNEHNEIVGSDLVSQIESNTCPNIYYSCVESECRISLQSGDLYSEAINENSSGNENQLYCTYVEVAEESSESESTEDKVKFVVGKEGDDIRIYGINNFPDISDISNSSFDNFKSNSSIYNGNTCDNELYFISGGTAAVIYKDKEDDENRRLATSVENDIYLFCSYLSINSEAEKSNGSISKDSEQSAFSIKYNLLTNKIQGNILGTGIFKNKTNTKIMSSLVNGECSNVLYYECSDSRCLIYQSAISDTNVAILNELLTRCDYAASDDKTAGFRLYYYGKYSYAIPTNGELSEKDATMDSSGVDTSSLTACPENVYYRCETEADGHLICSVTSSSENYNSENKDLATKKADLIGQGGAVNPSTGTDDYSPPDATTTDAEITICNYEMLGKYDEKSGYRIRYVKEIDELEVWPTGTKAKEALFNGGGYIINYSQISSSKIKEGNCMEEFYYKIDESTGNKYKFTLSENESGSGWNKASLK